MKSRGEYKFIKFSFAVLLLFTSALLFFAFRTTDESAQPPNDGGGVVVPPNGETGTTPTDATHPGVGQDRLAELEGILNDRFLILVNDENPLPEYFVPLMPATLPDWTSIPGLDEAHRQLEQAARDQAVRLIEHIREVEDLPAIITWAYPVGDARHGAHDAGVDEHATMLAIHVKDILESQTYLEYPNSATFAWIRGNAHYFGFILRYPADKVEQTGRPFSPVHLRYVGVEHATVMLRENMSLEEYVGMLRAERDAILAAQGD